MNQQILNTIGLVLAIVGVVIIFIWGPPQPQLDTGVSIGLEDATPIDKTGKTVTEYNQEISRRKNEYMFMSRLGLVLVMVGFAFQLWATWVPPKLSKSDGKPVSTDGSAKQKASESTSPLDSKDGPHNTYKASVVNREKKSTTKK